MLIAALEMEDLAKEPLADHVERRHDITAVTDVLQHHDVGLVLFGCVDHIPMVLQGDAEDDFGGDVFEAGIRANQGSWGYAIPRGWL